MSIVRVGMTSVSYGEAQCTLVKLTLRDKSHVEGTFDCIGDGVGQKEVLDLRLKDMRLRLIDSAGNVWQSTDSLTRC